VAPDRLDERAGALGVDPYRRGAAGHQGPDGVAQVLLRDSPGGGPEAYPEEGE
jgi:hypothetical protein